MTKCYYFTICNNYAESLLCIDCNMLFGKWRTKKDYLSFKNNIDCSICKQNELCIMRPQCEHFICIQCFKILYFNHKDDKHLINIKPNLKLPEYLEFKSSLKKCNLCIHNPI